MHGLVLGLIAVTLFAVGVPMTRLATGSVEAPQLPGAFVGFGRGVVAGVLAIAYLLATRAPFPPPAARVPLAIVAGGNVIAFPLAMSVALRHVESIHVSAMLGVGPLMIAIVGARMERHPQPAAFWVAAGVGSLLAAAFPFVTAGTSLGNVGFADGLLLGTLAINSIALVYGARLARMMPAAHVTAWSCVLALPVTTALAILTWPDAPASTAAWLGVAGVGVGTTWVGALLWFQAMAVGGSVRVSQLILVQPLIGMAFGVVLLDEVVTPVTAGFGIAIIGTVFIGRLLARRPSTG